MTLAVVDRLVHHATIFEMNVESYRRRTALERKRGPGRPPAHATIAAVTSKGLCQQEKGAEVLVTVFVIEDGEEDTVHRGAL